MKQAVKHSILEIIELKRPLCKKSQALSKKHWDEIAKPLHGLGKLEDVVIKIAGMTASSEIQLDKKALVVMCADNGVVEEGVTQTGAEVTAVVAGNFLTGQTTASILCKQAHTDVFPVDIGVAADTPIINKKIAYGTQNITTGPAMTRVQAIRAIETGIEMVAELTKQGYKIIATGEMGIGNTTTSSAITAVLLDLPVETVTGTGAGLSSQGMSRKIAAVKKAIVINQPDRNDLIDVVAKVGGLDIAGLVGVFLGGMAARTPIVIDGVISAVAAFVAAGLHPDAKNFMIASHISKEPAAQIILEQLDLPAYITCDMCLGEGTGAVTLFPLLDMAIAVYNGMPSFQEIQVEEYKPLV